METLSLTDRRKLPRLHISPSQFYSQALQKSFSVQDISLGGVSIHLIDREDLQYFAVGSIHEGVLKLEGLKESVKFQVKYIQGLSIGAAWMQASAELSSHIKKVTDPAYLGSHLKKLPLQSQSELTAEWYHAPVGVDLLVYSQEKLKRWILYFHQSFVQWDEVDGLHTGKSVAEDDFGSSSGVVRLETRLLDYDRKPDQRILDLAKEFLEHATILELKLKTEMLAPIQGAIHF